MISLFACITGFVLDFLFGDPVWIYHPIRLIGNMIAQLEKLLRRIYRSAKSGELLAGSLLCILVPLLSAGISYLCIRAAGRVHPILRYVLESFWCFQILAARSLSRESMKVTHELEKGDLTGARTAVSMIVGRDTDSLDEEGVVKATVETVAENTSDGVTAPLLFLLIGGAPLGFFYKAVNTMDSMVGYKNEKYLYFGRVAAKLDDILNYLPARISALLMILAAYLTGMNGKQAWKIFRRDRYKHASPNSAQTESVCAGALGIRLAGDAWYFGKLHQKEYIGDALRPIEKEDIHRSCVLMYATALLTMLLFGTLKYLLI